MTQGAHVNQYTLDGFHRVIREADSDVSTNDTRYRERAYTPDGQLAFESTWSHQLGNGVGNYYTYDALQRKTRVQTPYGDTREGSSRHVIIAATVQPEMANWFALRRLRQVVRL